jgi:phosphoserine aminotransferase
VRKTKKLLNRVFNFGAGPAMLPEEILREAQEELLNWQGNGLSILEIGHRTPEYQALMEEAEQNLRILLQVPSNYEVLFFGGPARSHFALIPLNFIEKSQKAAYLISGLWSELAFREAQHSAHVYCMDSSFDRITSQSLKVPSLLPNQLKENTAYLYYTPNETVNGVRFPFTPRVADLPLVADMTSCLLSEPINVGDYDLIFAGAQKNIANAGLTLVIIKQEFLDNGLGNCIPSIFNYQTHAQHKSLYATPPTFNCYLASKMFQWISKQGGVEALYQRNLHKSQKLYDYIDNSPHFECLVEPTSRSLVNVCFQLKNKAREAAFFAECKSKGLLGLKGHRTAGGIRASLYNAMPMAGVDALLECMDNFSRTSIR